jgi:hypothetical protein
MCVTIWLTVPRDVEGARLADGLARFPGKSALPIGRYENDTLFLIEGAYGACHCGTCLGKISARTNRDEAKIGRSLARFRREGWSETKIRRWLDEQEKTLAREERTFHVRAQHEPDAAEAEYWLRVLRHLLLANEVQHVGLHVGSVPEYSWEDTRSVRLTEADPELLMSMRDDTLYVFHA